VVCDLVEYHCTVRGKLKQGKQKSHTIAAVGDKVRFLVTDQTEGVIEEVLPRANKISRMASRRAGGHIEQVIMANLNQVVVVQSIIDPTPVAGFIDRLLIAGQRYRVPTVICINKCDLDEKAIDDPVWNYYNKIDCKVIFTSAESGLGVSELRDVLSDKISLLVGASGTGKSSLISAVMPGLNLRVSEVTEKTGLGRHTTTRTELFPIGDGFIADSAGIRGFDPWGIETEDLGGYFTDFFEHRQSCRFSSCIHENEPDCGVKRAVSSGALPQWRYKAYTLLLKQLRERLSEKSVRYRKKR
jgi:ribosome biogenesis GTPase / thiamine phosphate phosphatase